MPPVFSTERIRSGDSGQEHTGNESALHDQKNSCILHCRGCDCALCAFVFDCLARCEFRNLHYALYFSMDLCSRRFFSRGKSKVVASPYGEIEYTDGGNGPAVLVIHGSGGGYDQGGDAGELTRGVTSPSPRSLRGRDERSSLLEGRGEELPPRKRRQHGTRGEPLTRIASCDAIRPLPARGAR